MAGQRLTDKTELLTTPAPADLLMIVDDSDTTGSADGTSKKIRNSMIVQTDKVTIDNTAFKALHTDGFELVASPGAGFGIIPISVYIEQTPGGTPNDSTMGTTVGHINKDANYYWSSSRFWPKDTTYDGNVKFFTGDEAASKGQCAANTVEDLGFNIYAKDGSPDGTSTNSWVVYVTYRIIDIS
tara:strand:+ start:1451 stop:2002 length:552 start_codon:yes stop_codon:yes gene_type:complete